MWKKCRRMQVTLVPFWAILPVLAYAAFIRFLARPFLARRWPYFRRRASAPYFAAFVAMIAACGVALYFGAIDPARAVATVAYYCLVLAAAVEFFAARGVISRSS